MRWSKERMRPTSRTSALRNLDLDGVHIVDVAIRARSNAAEANATEGHPEEVSLVVFGTATERTLSPKATT